MPVKVMNLSASSGHTVNLGFDCKLLAVTECEQVEIICFQPMLLSE